MMAHKTQESIVFVRLLSNIQSLLSNRGIKGLAFFRNFATFQKRQPFNHTPASDNGWPGTIWKRYKYIYLLTCLDDLIGLFEACSGLQPCYTLSVLSEPSWEKLISLICQADCINANQDYISYSQSWGVGGALLRFYSITGIISSLPHSGAVVPMQNWRPTGVFTHVNAIPTL